MTKAEKDSVIYQMTKNLPILRMALGLTKDELGNLIGLSRYTIMSIENGKRKMTWNTFLLLILIFIKNDETDRLLGPLNSVYTRSGQNSKPNSNATNLHSSQKRCCSFGISSSNASPAFQVQKSIFHQMKKPIQVTVILPLLLAISLSWNDDIHPSISGISNDLIGVIPTIGQ